MFYSGAIWHTHCSWFISSFATFWKYMLIFVPFLMPWEFLWENFESVQNIRPWSCIGLKMGCLVPLLQALRLKWRCWPAWPLIWSLWRQICFQACSGVWNSVPVVVELRSPFPCWLSARNLSQSRKAVCPPQQIALSINSGSSPSHALTLSHFSWHISLAYKCIRDPVIRLGPLR